MSKRHEVFIREDIVKCYSDLSEINQQNKKQKKVYENSINKKLKILFKELGRTVSQTEVSKWQNN